MSLRTKLFIAVMVIMVGITTLLSLSLVVLSVDQVRELSDNQDKLTRSIVENWAFPEGQDRATILRNLREYIETFRVDTATPNDERTPPQALFDEILLLDEGLNVLLHARLNDGTNGTAQAAESLPYQAEDGRVYDPHCVEALRTGATRVDRQAETGTTIYRPVRQTGPAWVERLPSAAMREQLRDRLVLKLHVGLNLTHPLPSGTLIRQVVMVMVFGTVALVLVMFLMLRLVVLRPLNRLVGFSKSLAEGDYSIVVPDSMNRDEIGELQHAFGGMVREVVDHRNNLQTRVEEALREQRKAERGLMIAQRLAATGTLAAGIAHEINNPISGMQNAVRRLEKRLGTQLDSRGKEYLDLLREGLARVEEIVKQVLQYSRRKPNPEPFDLTEPIERAASFIQHKARRLKVPIHVRPPASGEEVPPVFADRGEIQQVFTNLLLNALDAIRDAREKLPDRPKDVPDEVEIAWRVVTHPPDVTAIQATVRDTGCGMGEDQALQAFDAFYTTKEDGSGLGLAIAHSIIDSHGGTIALDTEPGVGTTVTIELLPAELS